MDVSVLEHIRTQAVVVARSTKSEDEGRSLLEKALKDHPQLASESLVWFNAVMRGISKEQIFRWISQGFTILLNGVPYRTFGHLWQFLERLDEDSDNVLVLEDLLKMDEEELAKLWEMPK
ncbi:hypothetical protein [Sphingobacterium griseoflavum]|uniref:EF-hand domain-containing protein n=1 Tax=Sphingobacterium griseoflavum TaxID=1474952 RepID=A0ABQ3HVD2_9SPHI|nr:hypothetical protein [Sphingobacterium griseoflavum]GHE31227.1 hypothetical protein GCM10017764_12910 [Sphingobacterium griseoflavum]